MKTFLPLLLLAAAPVAAQAQAQPAPAISPLGPDSALLSLTAEGQSRRTPDTAMFSAGVVSQGKTASEALAENSRRMESVIAALRRAGVAERDIQTSALSIQPRYSNPELEAQIRARDTRQPYVQPVEPMTPRIIGYEARNNVQVRVRKIADMGRMVDALVGAGANEVNGPSFTVDEPRAALDEARAAAIATARQRAELYARAAGMRVVRIVSISEAGGYYPVSDIIVTGSRMSRFAAPPPPPIAPGELALGVNVSVQFELAR
jgi:hypothetical protein